MSDDVRIYAVFVTINCFSLTPVVGVRKSPTKPFYGSVGQYHHTICIRGSFGAHERIGIIHFCSKVLENTGFSMVFEHWLGVTSKTNYSHSPEIRFKQRLFPPLRRGIIPTGARKINENRAFSMVSIASPVIAVRSSLPKIGSV